jgi:WD40 repeat protein
MVLSANFSPDGKQIISASGDKNIKLWGLAGNCLRLLFAEVEIICLPSGLKFALVAPTKVCRQLPAKSQSLRILSGKQIISASGDKNIKLWGLAGNCLQTFVGHTAGVSSAKV